MSWAGNRVVTRIRRFRMRSTPDEYLVEVNLGVIPVLKRESEVRTELQPRFVRESVDPSLGIRLCAFDRTHVMRLSIICYMVCCLAESVARGRMAHRSKR